MKRLILLLAVTLASPALAREIRIFGTLVPKGQTFELADDNELVFKLDVDTNGVKQTAQALAGKGVAVVGDLKAGTRIIVRTIEPSSLTMHFDAAGILSAVERGVYKFTTHEGQEFAITIGDTVKSEEVEAWKGSYVAARMERSWDPNDTVLDVFSLARDISSGGSKLYVVRGGQRTALATFEDSVRNYAAGDLDCGNAGAPNGACKARTDKYGAFCYVGETSSVCNDLNSVFEAASSARVSAGAEEDVRLFACDRGPKGTVRIKYALLSYVGARDVLHEKNVAPCAE